MTHITKEQLEELREVESINRLEFNELLEEYTGIKANPYTAFTYVDSAGNWIGDSDNYTLSDLLENAYIEIKE